MRSFSLDDLALPLPTPFASRSRRAMTVLLSGESLDVDAAVELENARVDAGEHCEADGNALASERSGSDIVGGDLWGAVGVLRKPGERTAEAYPSARAATFTTALTGAATLSCFLTYFLKFRTYSR